MIRKWVVALFVTLFLAGIAAAVPSNPENSTFPGTGIELNKGETIPSVKTIVGPALQGTPQGVVSVQQAALSSEDLEPSPFERYVEASVGMPVKYFGFDHFLMPPSTFAPVQNVPVGPDYVLGPGDELRLTLWGMVNGEWSLIVDRDGNILIPEVGKVGVSGLSFADARESIKKAISRVFSNFEMNLSMGTLRTIQIFVVGNARRPGTYTVSSLSTLVNALFTCGGPSKAGSLRDIQLKRGGRTLVRFDLYDFLLKGDKSKDLRLMPGDVLFIPPVGPLAAVVGQVKVPAIYELKGSPTVGELISMAGGPSTTAYRGRVQVQQIEGGRFRVVREVDLSKAASLSLLSGEGSLINVFSLTDTPEKASGANTLVVSVRGEVRYPGSYSLPQGARISDLLEKAGGVTPRAFPGGVDFRRKSVRNLQQAQLDDTLKRMEIELLGTSANEMSSSLNASDANLLKAEADQKRSLLAKLKEVKATGRVVLRIADFSKIKGTEADLELEEGDSLLIPAFPQTVQVLGAVLNPTAFVYQPGLGIRDYLSMAGGYSLEASPDRIYLLKADGRALRFEPKGKAWPFDKARSASSKITLEPGDAIVVPQKVNSYKGLRQTRDWVDVIFKIAMSAAAVNNLTD